MTDLEYLPNNLMPLLALVRSILSIFHLVTKFEKRILNVLKAFWWWLAIASRSDGGHACLGGLLLSVWQMHVEGAAVAEGMVRLDVECGLP